MALRDRNISAIDDEIWDKAKRDALDHHMALRAWIMFLILRGADADNELRMVGEGIKR